MGKYGSSSFGFLLANGYDLRAAKLKGVTSGYEHITEPTDGLGDSNQEHTPVGVSQETFSQTGAFFDDATNGIHIALRGNSGSNRIVCWTFEGNTLGQPFTGAAGLLKTKYEVLNEVGGLTKANATYLIDGSVDDGAILQVHQQQTVDWTNTSVDNGASSANGGAGYLQVSQFSGITGFLGFIESSTDNLDWSTTLVSFTNVTAALTAQRIAVVGTIPRYLRFRGDVTGTGTITLMAGFARS